MAILTRTTCFHCGDDCPDNAITDQEKTFCCNGCYQVYQILSESKLNNYYQLNTHPGKIKAVTAQRFAYLDDAEMVEKIIYYRDEKQCAVSFYVPAIHCSSCIWLLEHLNTLNAGIIENRVDFLKKTVDIRFQPQHISLRQVAELLQQIGYPPFIQLEHEETAEPKRRDPLLLKMAVAGFCFGNAMLLSFPAYFGLSQGDQVYGDFFQLLALLFAIPSVFYAGADYFKQAYISLKSKVLDINFPLALGISVLFLRSLSEYIFHTGAGFSDSLTGLIFFLLVGKWVQQKTYHHLSFERDYRSFFPVAVQILDEQQQEKSIPLAKLKKGDRLLVKNQEIIPADAILLKGDASIDFSFVTGESVPVNKVLGELIYAGGKQCGATLELEVIKPVSQSYLTTLWNHDAFKKPNAKGAQTFVNRIAKHFTWVLLLIATLAFTFHLHQSWQLAINAFTAILIVACPCALALSTPFTMAAALSIFDKNKFYVKNTDVVEQMAAINHLVFDKTGTLTLVDENDVLFEGTLSNADADLIYAVCKHSSHPLSRRICSYIKGQHTLAVDYFQEYNGSGLVADFNGERVMIGKRSFILDEISLEVVYSGVHVKIGERYIGKFIFIQKVRNGFDQVLIALNPLYQIDLLSGDHAQGQQQIETYFKHPDQLHFAQSPGDKLQFIANLQAKGAKVMMIGDGLNDAGALKQSDVGVAITDEINNFTPSSDAILEGSAFGKIPQFLAFSKASVKIIRQALVISLIYNSIGIGFAISGELSPLLAAILMPLSTISIVTFCSIATHRAALKHHLIS